MRVARSMGQYPAGTALLSDDIVEFHAARVILLLHLCGTKNRIDGLTKLAKLDFFVRYPHALLQAINAPQDVIEQGSTGPIAGDHVEAPMVAYQYGPWDPRYYQLISYLEARRLVLVTRKGARTFSFCLTDIGVETAKRLATLSSFSNLAQHIRLTKRHLGSMSGERLKELAQSSLREAGQTMSGRTLPDV